MFGQMFNNNMVAGGRNEEQLEGYSEEIKSKDILSFSYVGGDFSLSAIPNNDKLTITCRGGGKYNERDGTLFSIKYDTEDKTILKLLQEIIDSNNETRGNGHSVYVAGLPAGIGDTLNVEYQSGEKLYKSSNQGITVNPDTAKKFYNTFHEFVIKEGYDFTTAGSNVKLFDDADEEFLQGTWKGTQFGDEIEVNINKNYLTIKKNNKITDDNVEYTIFQGKVVPNKLKEGVDTPETYRDYEFFKGISIFSKKNWFTMTGYFLEDNSPSFDLHNFDKEKPENEE